MIAQAGMFPTCEKLPVINFCVCLVFFFSLYAKIFQELLESFSLHSFETGHKLERVYRVLVFINRMTSS